MPTTQVRLLTVSAAAVSRVSSTAGFVLNYNMLVGVQPPRQRPIMFRHREYDEQVRPGTRSISQTFALDVTVAQRLITFIRTCFVRGRQLDGPQYDSTSFVNYLLGIYESPTEETTLLSEGSPAYPAEITLGKPYVIIDAHGSSLHTFFGLGPRMALSVYGRNAAMGICDVLSLIKAYGGTRFDEVTWVSRQF